MIIIVMIGVVSLYNKLIGRQNLKSDVYEYYTCARKMWKPSEIKDVSNKDFIPSLKFGKKVRIEAYKIKKFKNGYKNISTTKYKYKYNPTEIKLMNNYLVYLCDMDMGGLNEI